MEQYYNDKHNNRINTTKNIFTIIMVGLFFAYAYYLHGITPLELVIGVVDFITNVIRVLFFLVSAA